MPNNRRHGLVIVTDAHGLPLRAEDGRVIVYASAAQATRQLAQRPDTHRLTIEPVHLRRVDQNGRTRGPNARPTTEGTNP